MKDSLKNILTHGLAGSAGYYIGQRTADSTAKSYNLRTRMIPAILIASAILHFTTNVPSRFIDYLSHINDNKTKIEEKALEKGVYPYNQNSLNEINSEPKDNYNHISIGCNNLEKRFEDNIERIIEGNKETSGYRSVSSINASTNSREPSYVLIDKNRQSLSMIDEEDDIIFSAPIIHASSGGPDNGRYTIKEITSRSGDLYPYFIKLNGKIGISGSGEDDEYRSEIQSGENCTRSGFRLLNDDIETLASYSHSGMPVIVR